MIENLIKIMVDSGDYPKSRLNKILATEQGNILDYEVTLLFAEWTLNLKIPESKHIFYKVNDIGEWQNWTQE